MVQVLPISDAAYVCVNSQRRFTELERLHRGNKLKMTTQILYRAVMLSIISGSCSFTTFSMLICAYKLSQDHKPQSHLCLLLWPVSLTSPSNLPLILKGKSFNPTFNLKVLKLKELYVKFRLLDFSNKCLYK